MSRIKHFVLGVAVAALITTGLFSCSNEENNNSQQVKSETVMTTTSSTEEEFERKAIAVLDGGEAVPLYDVTVLETTLISEGFYDTIESIEVDYGVDGAGEYEAYFTVIGSKSTLAVAYQADLVIDEGELFITNPAITPHFFKKHTCAGKGCEGCAFEKEGSGLKKKIVGCNCTKPVEGLETPSYCDHSTTQEIGGAIQFVAVVVGLL